MTTPDQTLGFGFNLMMVLAIIFAIVLLIDRNNRKKSK